MSDSSWPRDARGIEIRKGDAVRLRLLDPEVLCYVAEVQPATVLSAPGGGVMPTQGTLVLRAQFDIPFAVDQPLVAGVLALKPMPEPGLAIVKPQ